MLAVYSDACKHAIRALVQLAALEPEARARIAELQAEGRLPQAALGKVLQRLAASGIVESARGPGGGFRLARDAASIRLADVVQSVDGWLRVEQCALGETTCSEAGWCPVHDHWSRAKASLLAMLETTTIAELARRRRRRAPSRRAPSRPPRRSSQR